jgi:outer membrane protein
VIAKERKQLASEQVQAFQESFRAAEIRFNAGVGTSVDYLTAKNNLDRSQLAFITSQYEQFLRLRVLEFYREK